MPPSLPFLRRRKDVDNQQTNGNEQQQSRSRSRSNSRLPSRLLRAALYALALILLILIETGSTRDAPVLRAGWFLRIDLSDIIPRSVPDAVLINSIARSIGLHDFYQVGLWGFCEGYEDGSGITRCSKPQAMYAFDPVEILLQELLAGASIALPSDITQALAIARLASRVMFALFILAAVLVFLCLILAPLAVPNRNNTSTTSSEENNISSSEKKKTHTPLTSRILRLSTFLLALLALLATLAACTVATALFTIFSIVFTNAAAAELNVRAALGVRMLVYMWLAVAVVLVGFVLQCRDMCGPCCTRCCGACCCCAGRKKKTKKRRGMRDMSEKDGNENGITTNGNDAGNENGAAKPGVMHRLGRLRV